MPLPNLILCRTSLAALLVVSGCGLVGCTGEARDARDPNEASGGAGRRFQCKPSESMAPSSLQRLSKVQYRNTVADVVQRALPKDASNILAVIDATLSTFPVDALQAAPGQRKGGFSGADQSVQQGHADTSYEVAVALGREFISSGQRMTALLGACATDASKTNDAACLSDFVKRFGAAALRHPLSDDDVSFYVQVAGTTPVAPEAVADVIGVILTAPEFMFMVEHGTQDGAAVAPLDAYELAARLSYHFWRAPPDDALVAAASSGALLTEEGLKAQVARLSSSPRASATWDEFFGEWFVLRQLPKLSGFSADPLLRAFAGGDVPDATTRDAAVADVLSMARWNIEHGGTVTDLLKDRRSYLADDLLSRIYGTTPWDGSSAPVEPSSAARVGLLTRPAFLISGNADTHPILRGVKIRNNLFCRSLSPPPEEANAGMLPPVAGTSMTTRQSLERLTETSAACAGCHQLAINPLGFALENFDALGRERTHETFFESDGTRLGSAPVDTHSQPQIVSGDPTVSSGAGDLTRLIADSGEFHSCIALEYFRFSFRRNEDYATDSCTLASLESQALEGRPLIDVLQSTALSPEFRKRNFQ